METKRINDVYEILEVDYTASTKEIKAAYLKLAKKYHPDKYPSAELKKEAEKKFKIIKEAYDTLIEQSKNEDIFINDEAFKTDNNNFSDFFYYEKKDFEDHLYDNENAFIQYYINNVLKAKKKKPDNIRKQIIDDFEKYIADNKLSEKDIFESIKNNRLIVKSTNDNLEEAKSNIIKEAVYRTHIKNTDKFQGFIKHGLFNKNLNVKMIFNINANYVSKEFNQTLNYKVYTLCKLCHGLGCDKCKDGYVIKEKKAKIKIENIENRQYNLVIKGGGCEGTFDSGDLNIILKIVRPKQNNVVDFTFVIKYKYNIKYLNQFQSIANSIEKVKTVATNNLEFISKKTKLCAEQLVKFFQALFKTLRENKTHTIYLGLISILLIVILLLAILL